MKEEFVKLLAFLRKEELEFIDGDWYFKIDEEGACPMSDEEILDYYDKYTSPENSGYNKK